MAPKIILASIVFLFSSCVCPEKESLKSINETILLEYEKYVNEDDSLSDISKRVRILRIESIRMLINERNR